MRKVEVRSGLLVRLGSPKGPDRRPVPTKFFEVQYCISYISGRMPYSGIDNLQPSLPVPTRHYGTDASDNINGLPG